MLPKSRRQFRTSIKYLDLKLDEEKRRLSGSTEFKSLDPDRAKVYLDFGLKTRV